jgi:DNA-binding MarR family transcriptional regulator
MNPELTIYLIARIREKANRLITEELNRHNLRGIAPSHGDIMLGLFKNTELSMKELAEYIDRDKSTVTYLINKLTQLGYVEKKPGIRDRRKSLISLTRKGRELRGDIIEISEKLLARVFKSLSNEERDVLNELLTRINENW